MEMMMCIEAVWFAMMCLASWSINTHTEQNTRESMGKIGAKPETTYSDGER